MVTVKAELAQRLLDVDLDRARAELRDLEALARDALADVRATALGVRGISLPGEIAAARAALAAANVEADLPGAADEVPTRQPGAVRLDDPGGGHQHRAAQPGPARRGAAGPAQRGDPRRRRRAPAGRRRTGRAWPGLRRRAGGAGRAASPSGRREDEPGFRVRVEVPS